MDPFEAAFEDSPPQSPEEAQPHADAGAHDSIVGAEDISNINAASASASAAETPPEFPPPPATTTTTAASIEFGGGSSSSSSNAPKNKEKEKEDEEEEEEEDVELKFPSSSDPHKSANMQAILSHFTEEQMSRYESFRRSGFQKSSMKRLLVGITGTQKISVPITIVVSGIAKMFVGDVVETARIVMTERKETGPIRPCHLREAYRRLKLEGKTFKRPGSRLFR